MSFQYTPFRPPFQQWFGPYSPARGTDSGFRVRDGRLSTTVDTGEGWETWVVQASPGVSQLESLVLRHWQGGRVLLLPNGLVIKPSSAGDGERWVIGQMHGPVILEKPDGGTFNLADPGLLRPGDLWPGPSTTGIACVINRHTGTVRAERVVPTAEGFLKQRIPIWDAAAALAEGFAIARPYHRGGRIRITANGHVITNRQRNGAWECVYVGLINVDTWPHSEEWADVDVAPPYRDTLAILQEAIETARSAKTFIDILKPENETSGDDEPEYEYDESEAPYEGDDDDVEDVFLDEWHDDDIDN